MQIDGARPDEGQSTAHGRSWDEKMLSGLEKARTGVILAIQNSRNNSFACDDVI